MCLQVIGIVLSLRNELAFHLEPMPNAEPRNDHENKNEGNQEKQDDRFHETTSTKEGYLEYHRLVLAICTLRIFARVAVGA